MLILSVGVGAFGLYLGAPWWLAGLLAILIGWTGLTSLARWLALFAVAAVGITQQLGGPWWLAGAVVLGVAAVAIVATIQDCRAVAANYSSGI